MMEKTSARRRFAALTSGALIAGGLVAAPAVAGLSTASAAPVSIAYTCSGQSPVGPMTLPGTVTLDVTTPASVLPGSDYTAAVTAEIDLGSLPPTVPISELTGSFAIPFSAGGDSATFTTPSQTAPKTAMVYTGSGSVGLTAPAEVGDVPITVGEIAATLSALGGAVTIDATCVPAAGESLTVGSVTVAEDAPPPPPDPVAVPVTGTVKVTGAAKVGKTLKAIPGVTDGATVTYQWLSNGAPIANATKPTLKLNKSLKGKKVSVQATYSKTDFLDVVQTSKAVKVKK